MEVGRGIYLQGNKNWRLLAAEVMPFRFLLHIWNKGQWWHFKSKENNKVKQTKEMGKHKYKEKMYKYLERKNHAQQITQKISK